MCLQFLQLPAAPNNDLTNHLMNKAQSLLGPSYCESPRVVSTYAFSSVGWLAQLQSALSAQYPRKRHLDGKPSAATTFKPKLLEKTESKRVVSQPPSSSGTGPIVDIKVRFIITTPRRPTTHRHT